MVNSTALKDARAEFGNEEGDIYEFTFTDRRLPGIANGAMVKVAGEKIRVSIYEEDRRAIEKLGYSIAGDPALQELIPVILDMDGRHLRVIQQPDGSDYVIRRAGEPATEPDDTPEPTPRTVQFPAQVADEPQSSPCPEVNPLASLYAKMARVMGKVQRIPKTGTNQHFNYKFATEADIADAVRTAMSEVGLAFFSEILDYHREAETVTRNAKGGGTYETTKYTTYLKLLFTFACVDTGATVNKTWYSEADDDQDKGISKAVTLAQKYFLKSTFIISTGDLADDPDAGDDNTDQPRSSGVSSRKTPAQKPTPKPAKSSTPASDDNAMPDELFQALMKDSGVAKAGKNGQERANTIRKMWGEGKFTDELEVEQMAVLVIERLESH